MKRQGQRDQFSRDGFIKSREERPHIPICTSTLGLHGIDMRLCMRDCSSYSSPHRPPYNQEGYDANKQPERSYLHPQPSRCDRWRDRRGRERSIEFVELGQGIFLADRDGFEAVVIADHAVGARDLRRVAIVQFLWEFYQYIITRPRNDFFPLARWLFYSPRSRNAPCWLVDVWNTTPARPLHDVKRRKPEHEEGREEENI